MADEKGLPALLLTRQAVAADSALLPGARGARKHIVTELFDKKETEAIGPVWVSPAEGEKCPVVVAKGLEMASFTEVTAQDRHYHKVGTEIYIVLAGMMRIEVDGLVFTLELGDTLVVNPDAVHQVLVEEGDIFLTRVITGNCGGGERQVRRLANRQPLTVSQREL